MRNESLIAALAVACVGAAHATTWYVSPNGSNANSGTASSAPFATLQYAEGMTEPGDTVLLMNGTYTNDQPGDNVLLVDRAGTASAPIVYAPYPGAHPVLQVSNSWAAILVDASYITIEGFEIAGNAENISNSYGTRQARNLSNPITNGDGIDIDGPYENGNAHHVTIQNMLIHDLPGGGIAVNGADYLTITGNVIYGTSHWSPYGDSAISLYELADVDTNTGVKNIIESNVIYNNAEWVPSAFMNFQTISDGNGIIIDDNLNAQSDGVPYNGRTLVAFNVSYGNGGSGIHAFSSQHVDILNNTAYGNNTTASIDEGQIFAMSSNDVRMIDNIMVAPSGKLVTATGTGTNVTEDYNVLWAVSGSPVLPASIGGHDIVADPELTDPADGIFTLQAGSPAAGTADPGALLITSTDRGAE